MKNLPLTLGAGILLVLLVVALFPSYLSPSSPYTVQQLRFSTLDSQLTIDKAPFPPSPEYPLGSDDLGRDIWSYIVYGTRTTLLIGLLAALAQFLVALPLAMWGGTGHRGTKYLITYSNVFLSAIPALLLSVLVLQIDFFGGLDRIPSISAFIAVLTAVAWPRLGALLLERVESLNREPFIMGEVALGKSRWRIASENLLPHLLPEVVVLFFMEVARNLSMMMQLGLFGVFIGNLRLVMDSGNGRLTFFNISYEPEWASMLSTSSTYLTVAPWTVIFPALAFFVSVLGFNLFGEGLRLRLQQEKTASLLDRRQLVGAGALILGLGLFAWALSPNLETFRIPSPPTPYSTATTIGAQMAELGLTPGLGDSFLVPYPLEPARFVEDQSFQIRQAGSSESQAFVAGRDFSFNAVGPEITGNQIVDARFTDLISLSNFGEFQNRLILLDTSFYSDSFLRSFIQRAVQVTPIPGFLLVARDQEMLPGPIIDSTLDTSVVTVSRPLADLLVSTTTTEVYASARTIPLSEQGVNLVGTFSPNPQAPGNLNEYIALGFGYDNPDFGLELMNRLTQLDKSRRSFLFLFTDSPQGVTHFSDHLPVSAHRIKVFLDLRNLGDGGNFVYSTKQAPITRQFAWSLGTTLTKAFTDRGMTPDQIETTRVGAEYRLIADPGVNAMFWNAGVATIHIGGEVEDLEGLGDILLKALYTNNY